MMKKQIRHALVLFGLLVVIASGTTATAQGQRVVVSIPFDFVVGNERMPAGDYTISRISHAKEEAFLVRSADGSVATIVLTGTVERDVASDKARLSFTRYEDQYFLAQIWTPGSKEGRGLFKSRLEKSLERDFNISDQTARKSAEVTTVTIGGTMQ